MTKHPELTAPLKVAIPGIEPDPMAIQPRSIMAQAREIDRTVAILRQMAYNYYKDTTTSQHRAWEGLREASLEFARVHDRYQLAQHGRGEDQLVGTFGEVSFGQASIVGRVGTNSFRFWCQQHGRELGGRATDSDNPTSYPFFVREGDTWRIDLSEVFCPDEPDDLSVSGCASTWLILEVPDVTLEVPEEDAS